MLGATPLQYGMIEGLSTFFGMIGAAPAGELSDRVGRKKLYWIGHAVMGITRLLLGLISSIWMLFPLRWLYRLGMSVRYAARDPLLVESSSHETLGLTFAAYELSDCVGSFLGPLLPILILKFFGESLKVIRSLFLISFIPNLLAVILIVAYIVDTVRQTDVEKASTNLATKIRFVINNKNLLYFTGITFVTTLFAMTVDLELLYLTYGSLKANVLFSSVMFTFWTATTALAALPAGRIADKVGRKYAVALAFLFNVISVTIILIYHYVFRSVLLLPLAFASLGLYDTFLNVSSKTFVADNTSTENRGMVMGLYTTIDGISRRSLAPILAGLMFTHFSYSTPFMVAFVVSLLTIILLIKLVKEPNARV
jgi:MFS family permease